MQEKEIKCPGFGMEKVNAPFHDFSTWSSDHDSECNDCGQKYSMREYVEALEQKLRGLGPTN